MSAGNDQALLSLCWQSWGAYVEDYKKNKEMEDAVKAAEQQLADFTKKKSEEAKGVLNRMSGATESGLVASAYNAWRDYFLDLKQSREIEEMIANSDSVFKNWATESALSKVMKHYAGKMDQKKHQLEAVQTMFKSFAVQLEQGIGNAANTPRTQRRSEKQKPPQIPAA